MFPPRIEPSFAQSLPHFSSSSHLSVGSVPDLCSGTSVHDQIKQCGSAEEGGASHMAVNRVINGVHIIPVGMASASSSSAMMGWH